MRQMLLALLGALIAVSGAQAETITISWDPPTAYENGDPLLLSDISYYRINWRIGTTAQPALTAPGTATSVQVDTAIVGTHCFTAQTVDIHDAISDPSNEACKAVAAPNSLPVITPVTARAWNVGKVVSYQMLATDADSDPITWSATGLPAGVTISSAGLISGKPTSVSSGTATVTASDGKGSSTATFSWTVTKRKPGPPKNVRL